MHNLFDKFVHLLNNLRLKDQFTHGNSTE